MSKKFMVRISEDEWYPVLTVRTVEGEQFYGDEFEVDEETLKEWRKAFANFGEVQQQIRNARQKADRIRNLPKDWWSVVIRNDTSYQRYGFYGNVDEIATERLKIIQEYLHCTVDTYRATNKHGLEYKREQEARRDKQDEYDTIQERLSNEKVSPQL